MKETWSCLIFWLICHAMLINEFYNCPCICSIGKQLNWLLFNALNFRLTRFYTSDTVLFEKALQTQLLRAPKSCDVFDDVRNLLPALQYHISVSIGESGRSRIIQLLKQLTKLCHLDDFDESHRQNQRILYNSGNSYHYIINSLQGFIQKKNLGEKWALQFHAPCPLPHYGLRWHCVFGCYWGMYAFI